MIVLPVYKTDTGKVWKRVRCTLQSDYPQSVSLAKLGGIGKLYLLENGKLGTCSPPFTMRRISVQVAINDWITITYPFSFHTVNFTQKVRFYGESLPHHYLALTT